MAYTSTTQKSSQIHPLKLGAPIVQVTLVAAAATAATAYTFDIPFGDVPEVIAIGSVGVGTLPAVTAVSATAVTVSAAAAGTIKVTLTGKAKV